MVERNLNDFTQTYNDSNLSQKSRNVQNSKANPFKVIPSLYSNPPHNRSQILDNPTLQTQDSNENREDEETITGIFYNSKLPEELKNDRNKRLECKKPKLRTKQPRLGIKTRGLILETGQFY